MNAPRMRAGGDPGPGSPGASDAATGGPSPLGQVFLVIAPSGAGKSSLVNALLARDPSIELSISYTTRPARPGEADGREYHFVGREEFERRRADGEFLESAHVHGNHYATSREQIARRLQVGRDILLEIDWQGARQVRAAFAHSIGIFLLPPSFVALEERLHRRGQDSPEVIARRLANARGEMEHALEFDYLLVNEVFEDTLVQFQAIVAAARLRSAPQARRHAALLRELGIG
jgi:guanylate kinase